MIENISKNVWKLGGFWLAGASGARVNPEPNPDLDPDSIASNNPEQSLEEEKRVPWACRKGQIRRRMCWKFCALADAEVKKGAWQNQKYFL